MYLYKQICQVFAGSYMYSVILGHDFLPEIHFQMNFNHNTMNCMDITSIFKESKYKSLSIPVFVIAQTNLPSDQHTTLFTMLTEHINLFDGILKFVPIIIYIWMVFPTLFDVIYMHAQLIKYILMFQS